MTVITILLVLTLLGVIVLLLRDRPPIIIYWRDLFWSAGDGIAVCFPGLLWIIFIGYIGFFFATIFGWVG